MIIERCVVPTTTHQAKQIVKRGKFASLADKPELVKATDFWHRMLYKHKPDVPMEGPLRLEIYIWHPHRTSSPKKFKSEVRWKDTKPDCDNLSKTITDVMASLSFFKDDGQVGELFVNKYWSGVPGFAIVLIHQHRLTVSLEKFEENRQHLIERFSEGYIA